MNLDAALAAFEDEARELLTDMESSLLSIEGGQAEAGAINAIFRAAHTIKGSSGMFGLDSVVAFTHHVESLMDDVRNGTTQLTTEMVSLLLKCGDHIGFLINEALGRVPRGETEAQRETVLLAGLAAFLGDAHAPADAPHANEAPAAGSGGPSQPAPTAPSGGDNDGFHVRVHFGTGVFGEGMDPLSFIRYLGTLGTVHWVHSELVELGTMETFDPEACYIRTELVISGKLDEDSIRAAFEFIEDQCDLTITPCVCALTTEPGSVPSATATEPAQAVTAAATPAAAAPPKPAAPAVPTAGAKPAAPAVPADSGAKADAKSADNKFLRVEADKLDQLINLIGELVIAGASSTLIANSLRSQEMMEATSNVSTLVEAIRDTALNLRMVQIGATFSRFQRVVRDLSQELGKEIDLQISGADTELDKSVVEKIADPLTHLVRNSLDHGIESRERRIEAGKSVVGILQLHAYHESGSIVIEVADDGGGLNLDKIKAKAIERGLITPNASLTPREIQNLIFEPGFSTADAVTNLSGRGVGMDVVRQNIQSLRGTIELDSEMGVGTITRIRLPLTLAIIDGFLVGVGDGSYVVPLSMVVECVELSRADVEANTGRNYINLRGEVLPFIRLRDMFEKNDQPVGRQNIVVVNYAGRSAGLVVDKLLGDFQTVIKPLGPLFSSVRGISGSTILGSGEVALILDVPALVELATRMELHDTALLEKETA